MTKIQDQTGGNGVKTKLHVFCKVQFIGVPSLNDLAVNGM